MRKSRIIFRKKVSGKFKSKSGMSVARRNQLQPQVNELLGLVKVVHGGRLGRRYSDNLRSVVHMIEQGKVWFHGCADPKHHNRFEVNNFDDVTGKRIVLNKQQWTALKNISTVLGIEVTDPFGEKIF